MSEPDNDERIDRLIDLIKDIVAGIVREAARSPLPVATAMMSLEMILVHTIPLFVKPEGDEEVLARLMQHVADGLVRHRAEKVADGAKKRSASDG